MPGNMNPWDIPEWHAIGREAALVRSLIGSGVTSLGRANYANQRGEYYTAFFGLSIGLERLAKLVLVVDYAISSGGQMPEQKIVRKFGHKLVDLISAVDAILQKHQLSLEFSRPSDVISAKILECLDDFADAGRGRYANFASLGDPNLGQEEPISKWWGDVAELILRKHYYGKQVQARVEARAQFLDSMISPFSLVRHTTETGDPMQDVLSASIRTGQTEVVQRFGRYYTLRVVRWLAEVFSELSRTASYKHSIDAFFGVWEYLQSYTVEDSFLKTRKVWPLS
jgi:hypothetical protein